MRAAQIYDPTVRDAASEIKRLPVGSLVRIAHNKYPTGSFYHLDARGNPEHDSRGQVIDIHDVVSMKSYFVVIGHDTRTTRVDGIDVHVLLPAPWNTDAYMVSDYLVRVK